MTDRKLFARHTDSSHARHSSRKPVLTILRLALDVLIVYPAVVLAVLLFWGGGFSFEGMARSYVNEMATYAGRPATETALTALVCLDPQPVIPKRGHAPGDVAPLQLPGACQHWQPQLVSKDVIAEKLAVSARFTYWFLVLTALAIRLALAWASSFVAGRSVTGASLNDTSSSGANSSAVKRLM